MRALKWLLIVLGVGALVLAMFARAPAPDEVFPGIVDQVVAAIPRDVHLRILAVGEFEGPEGETFRRLLQSALEEHTDFVLVERSRIDRVLSEQKFQSLPLVDERSRIELGAMLGAEGIIFGRVTRLERGLFGTTTAVVHVTLDDVQRGEICFDREFSGTARSPLRARLLFLAAAFFVGGFLAHNAGRLFLGLRHRTLDRAEEVREDAVAEIARADRLIADLQTRAHRQDDERVGRIREIRNVMSDLRARVEAAAGGDPDLHRRFRDRQALRTDREVARAARSLRERIEKVVRGDRLPSPDDLTRLLDEVRAAEASFRGRRLR